MDDLAGRTFGAYRILDRVGEGGMAVVYKGYQDSLGRYVAVKVLRSELARDQEFVNRFRREALAVAQLNHPNILHVYDAGSEGGLYYMVMGFVDGGSLKDLIARGPLDPEYAVSIATQLADALDYAHHQGIIHRDVKPSNVLMTRDGRPMLTDFGIAKALYETAALTRTGISIGTPEYMAPEQIQGQPVDGRTDIYSLGIVLYEMLTGWAPFSTPTPVATLYKQVNEPPPPLHQVNVAVPDWLEGVVGQAVAKRPETRYQTGAEFAEALRQRRAPTPLVVPPAARGAGAAADRRTPTGRAVGAAADHGTPAGRGGVAAADHRTPPPPSGGARTPAESTAAPGRRRAVPLLVGAIALLAVGLLIAAVALLSGGKPQAPVLVTQVVTSGGPAVVTMVVTSGPEGQAKEGTVIAVANPTTTGDSALAGGSQATAAVPTDTPTPRPPTDTPVPPTDTPVPLTDTPVPPTNTSPPPAPTNTPSQPQPTRTSAPPASSAKVLIFTSTQLSENDLFSIDEKGANRKRLTKFGKVGRALYSPNGRQIVFSRTESDNPYNADVYVMAADGSNQRNVTSTGDFVELDPSWSSDGTRIVFRGGPTGGRYSQIWLMNADGSGRSFLIDPNNMNSSPTWSPKSQAIAFVNFWEGEGGQWTDKGDIFVVNANGSGLTNLTKRGEAFADPTWSPNGQELIYGRLTRDRSTGEYWQVWRMNADGTGQRCIIGCTDPWRGWSNVPVAWRGSRIAFRSYKDGNWDVFIANADGSGIVQLTRESFDEKTRDWQP